MPVQYYSWNDSGAPEFKYLSGGYGASVFHHTN